jgi:hypothetical protein
MRQRDAAASIAPAEPNSQTIGVSKLDAIDRLPARRCTRATT